MENQQMGEERLDQYLNFIKETELLKNVLLNFIMFLN